MNVNIYEFSDKRRDIMILLYLLISLMPLCNGQNAALSFGCNKAGEDTLTMEAVYSGSGTPLSVIWTYSGSSLTVATSGCSVFGTVPANFPSKLSYKCVTTDASLPANTYQLIVSDLQNDILGKTWAVTFTPPVGAAPTAVQSNSPSDCSDCTCECKCKCKNMVFASIAIGIAGAITLLIVVGGTVKERIGRKTALVVAFIGILCGVTSFVLGIVVQAIDCCEDCCEDSDCCECERNWVENTGAAFIAIGALVGIAGGVIFYRVWFGRMGPGNNGGNGFFCFNNGNDDGNDGGNDSGNNGHHRGRGTNSSTVHTERADTHRGTLSDRANSDGEVSRKDVHVQENRDNFSGRPMPPIPPLTDKKGRGLSANYDDDHPMTSVGIPDKKAGQLVPLKEQKEQKKTEESKKRRKRKKKAVSDDDDDDDDVV